MEIFQIVAIALGVLTTLLTTYIIPFIVKYSKNSKLRSIAEKTLVMTDYAREVIEQLESQFSTQDKVLKSVNPALSLGMTKKESAMSKMLSKALELDLKFDGEYWSKSIDEMVELTKSVNQRDKDQQTVT